MQAKTFDWSEGEKFVDGYAVWCKVGITQAHFRRACAMGELPSKRTGQSHSASYIVRVSDLKKWLDNLPDGTVHISRPVKNQPQKETV